MDILRGELLDYGDNKINETDFVYNIEGVLVPEDELKEYIEERYGTAKPAYEYEEAYL